MIVPNILLLTCSAIPCSYDAFELGKGSWVSLLSSTKTKTIQNANQRRQYTMTTSSSYSCETKRKSGAGFEPATFGLEVQRATIAPPRQLAVALLYYIILSINTLQITSFLIRYALIC